MQTILVADDCPVRREQLCGELTRSDYFTIQATTAQEALGILRALHVDLLLTRERLADVEGTELAAIARSRGLDELVVVVIAHDELNLWGAVRDGTVDAVMARDASLGAIVRAVRRLLRPVTLRAPTPAASAATAYALPRA